MLGKRGDCKNQQLDGSCIVIRRENAREERGRGEKARAKDHGQSTQPNYFGAAAYQFKSLVGVGIRNIKETLASDLPLTCTWRHDNTGDNTAGMHAPPTAGLQKALAPAAKTARPQPSQLASSNIYTNADRD